MAGEKVKKKSYYKFRYWSVLPRQDWFFKNEKPETFFLNITLV